MIPDRIRERAAALRSRALDLLETLVLENSHWGNPQGVNRVGELVLEAMPSGLERSFTRDGNGVRHHTLTGPGLKDRGVLLVGHLDI